MEKTVNITNFIGVYDGYIMDEECNRAIKIFEDQDKFNNTLNRKEFENAPVLQKQDQQFFAAGANLNLWWEDLKTLIANFDIAKRHYIDNVGFLEAYGQDELSYTQIKIQKTLPTQGYHRWHLEHSKGFECEPRALAFTVYLNDIEEGGETEFLHFSKRVKPKTGRIVIWPAGFPYVHRGNPPLSGVKYILTSWMMLS